MQLSLSKYSFLFIFLVSLCSFANEEEYEVPVCPKEISVASGVVSGAGDWQVSWGRNFIKENGEITMRDGVLNTDGMYPGVGVLSDGSQNPVYIISDTEEYTDHYEIFGWNEDTFAKDYTHVYMCNAYGSQSEHPVRLITLYKPIPKKIMSCEIKFYLTDESRTWGGQSMNCLANKN